MSKYYTWGNSNTLKAWFVVVLLVLNKMCSIWASLRSRCLPSSWSLVGSTNLLIWLSSDCVTWSVDLSLSGFAMFPAIGSSTEIKATVSIVRAYITGVDNTYMKQSSKNKCTGRLLHLFLPGKGQVSLNLRECSILNCWFSSGHTSSVHEKTNIKTGLFESIIAWISFHCINDGRSVFRVYETENKTFQPARFELSKTNCTGEWKRHKR